MKLLISVTDEKETSEALKGSNDVIIDIKNPKEGSLGANFPHVITKIKKVIPKGVEFSAAIGDIPNMPGTASMAALGAATCGANYVKVGLKGPKTKEEAVYLMKNVVRTIKEFDKSVKVVVAGYADYKRAQTLDPLVMPEVAYEAGADVVMLDTAIKDGKKLLDFLEFSYLKSFVEKAHEMNLMAAFAGSLGKDDIEKIYKTGADVFGVRGAVCSKFNREGRLESELVRSLAKEVAKMKG
jgi:hypothetical protein